MRNRKNLIETIVEFILRPISLNAILFILVTFFLKELTAYSQGENLIDLCSWIEGENKSKSVLFISKIIKTFLTNGSIDVILITLITILPFAFLKYTELRNEKDNWKTQTMVFCGILFITIGSVYYILSKFEFQKQEIVFQKQNWECPRLKDKSWRFENVNYVLKGNGHFSLDAKQTNNSQDSDWIGNLTVQFINKNNKIIDELHTPEIICNAKGVLSKGKTSQSINFDTLVSSNILRKIELIKLKPNAKKRIN